VKYIEVMQRCIKLYEYEGTHVNLEKFNMDLRELQSWRRRSLVSQQKIRAVIRHLKWHNSSRLEHCVDVDLILADFEAIKKDIDDLGRRLENMLPVVTSLVQIMDARQSLAETANISRLTVLALVFVPLSYVSSLFSMNSTHMPGGPHFWMYFAVAFPVTLIVFTVARPPTKDGARQLLMWAQTICETPCSISSQAANKEWEEFSA
jgi:Mg2+ and Co2+ transporter CorA